MSRRKQCDFSQFLRREPGESEHSRAFRLVAVQTARWVLKRRRAFLSGDVKLAHRVATLHPKAQHSYVTEFLSSWESGASASHSRLADEMLATCPTLRERVIKYWRGW